MLAQRANSNGIAIGDEFLNFVSGGKVYQEGQVDEVTDDDVFVDFGDFRVRYERAGVRLMEEHCGYIRSFYASVRRGEIVEQYR